MEESIGNHRNGFKIKLANAKFIDQSVSVFPCSDQLNHKGVYIIKRTRNLFLGYFRMYVMSRVWPLKISMHSIFPIFNRIFHAFIY